MTVMQTSRRYVRDQLAIMAKHGSRPRLGRRRYWRLVRDVARVFAALRQEPKP